MSPTLRLTRSLALRTVAEGGDLAATLRAFGGPDARRAAQQAAAGALEASLRALLVEQDLVRLAVAWPAALPAAERRMAALPSVVPLQIRLAATALVLWVLSVVSLIVVSVCLTKVVPTFQAIIAELSLPTELDTSLVGVALFLLPLVAVGAASVALSVLALPPERLPWWGVHLREARRAALAGALHDHQAPAATVREVLGPVAPAGWAIDHDLSLDPWALLVQRRAAQADATTERIVAATRYVGLTLISVPLLLLVVLLYTTLGKFQP